jgi:hypothetical protein
MQCYVVMLKRLVYEQRPLQPNNNVAMETHKASIVFIINHYT